MRRRSGHGKAKPQSGRISALCGRSGPFTGAYAGISGAFWQTALRHELSTAESRGPAPAAWVPIQWLTIAHKIPFWRGDGSRSGPSPCKAIRDKKPLKSLVTSSGIKSDVVPGLWPGAAALFSAGEELDGQVLLCFSCRNFGCCN